MDKLREFLKENPDNTLWEYLACTDKPIVIYGMGDGAHKIITVLEKKGIEYKDIFASDGFVRGQSFHGRRVKAFSEIKDEYPQFIILVAFASKHKETVDMLYELSAQYELYAPDVNVSGDYTEVFDGQYYLNHRDKLYSAMMLFEESAREKFCRIIDFKISGKLEYLHNMDQGILPPSAYYDTNKIYSYIDLGAYNGDTLKSALEIHPNLSSAVAMEPDEKNFSKLFSYAQTLDINVKAFNNAAWNTQCEMTLHMGFGKNTTLGDISDGLQKKKEKIIKALPPDDTSDKADLIKYDVEGSEYEALEGSKRLISSFTPVLVVSMYHNNDDLFRLPELIKSFSSYKLYISRKPCIPAWETEIVAVHEKYAIQGEQDV